MGLVGLVGLVGVRQVGLVGQVGLVRQVGLVGVRAKASEGLELGMWGQRFESESFTGSELGNDREDESLPKCVAKLYFSVKIETTFIIYSK